MLDLANEKWDELRALFVDSLKTLTAFCDANLTFAHELKQLQLPQLQDMVILVDEEN